MGKLYAAFRSASVPDSKAIEAIEEIAGHKRLYSIETYLILLTCMTVSVIIIFIVSMCLLVRIAAKVGAI